MPTINGKWMGFYGATTIEAELPAR